MNNDIEKISVTDNFDLREKRLKLVYRIFYVAVFIWLATIVSLGDNSLVKNVVPAYAFLLAVTGVMIVKIVKYSLMEFRCMKISEEVNVLISKQTEAQYDNIWKSFWVEFALIAELMILNVLVPKIFSEQVLMVIIEVCTSYFLIKSIVNFFSITRFNSTITMVLNFIAMFVGSVTAYCVCCLVCLFAI